MILMPIWDRRGVDGVLQRAESAEVTYPQQSETRSERLPSIYRHDWREIMLGYGDAAWVGLPSPRRPGDVRLTCDGAAGSPAPRLWAPPPGQVTVKLAALLTVPTVLLVTVIGPLEAPFGTLTTSCVELGVEMAAVFPLNLTTELELNPTPVIVTSVPTPPLVGLRPVIDNVTV